MLKHRCIVLRGREYIAALKPCGDGLHVETLRFADEVRAAASVFANIGHADAENNEELVGLAEELIQRKSAPFDESAFKDRYPEALKRLIDAKGSRRPPVAIDEEAPARGAQIIDLMAALKGSVGDLRGGAKASPRGSQSPARRPRRA